MPKHVTMDIVHMFLNVLKRDALKGNKLHMDGIVMMSTLCVCVRVHEAMC